MDLSKLISITEKPGLYRLVSQTKGGFIVEELINSKKLVINANSQVSLLQNISIFTIEDSEPLDKLFSKIAEHYDCEEVKFNKSDTQKLRSMLEELLPEYDPEKVYDSDIRKLFQWYNILIKINIITKENYKNITTQTEEQNSEDLKEDDNKEENKIEQA